MKEIFQSAFVIPSSKIPELYINRSLEIQLAKYFLQFGGKVGSQSAPFLLKEEHNCYHTSLPDLVLWLNSPVTVCKQSEQTHEDEGEGETDGEEQEEEDRIACSELKKGTHGLYQLYGESFNVAASYACLQVRNGKPLTSVTVYCLLLVKECRYGKLAEITIDFNERKCALTEDPNERTTDECFQILVSLLQKQNTDFI